MVPAGKAGGLRLAGRPGGLLTSLSEAVERVTAGSGSPLRLTPGMVLVGGMVASTVLVFTFGSGAWFSGDELSVISLVGRLEPSELLEPYVGHLVAVPLLVYRIVLDIFGTDSYIPFQALTLGAIFLLVWVLFLWARERVTPWVAVAPCLLLTIFPQDVLHYLAGNGFTVIFALACGVGALYAFERGTRGWDVAAFFLITLGMLTYTVAVAFAIGLLVAGLLAKDRRRTWVAAIPLLAYVAWRVTEAGTSGTMEDSGPDLANLLLLPSWAFQAIGASLTSLLGLKFEFIIPRPEVRIGASIAPGLALLFLGFGAVVVARRKAGPGLVVVSMVALALYASQLGVWGITEGRGGPDVDRYLYPGALVVVMITLELLRMVRWDRFNVGVVWLVTLFSLVSSVGLLDVSSNRVSASGKARAEVLGVALLESMGDPPPIAAQPRNTIRRSFDPVDGSRFGYVGFTEADLAGDYSKWGGRLDAFLAESLGVRLRPVPEGISVGVCRPVEPAVFPFGERAALPPGGAILYSTESLRLLAGRYGERATLEIGTLTARLPALLRLEPDEGRVPWYLTAGRRSVGTLAEMTVCRYRSGNASAITSPLPAGGPSAPTRTSVR